MSMPDLVNLRAAFDKIWWLTMLAKADHSQHLRMYSKFISSLLHYLTYTVPSIFELVQ